MDDATEELYLQKIEEFVHDEDLIISTEVLCRKLNINIADAKHLITKYLTDHRNIKPKELGVTYAILGKLAIGDKFSIILVTEENLDEKLSLFKTGYSKEIYSIQKATNPDINLLNLLNAEPREKALLGSIIGKNCVASRRLVSKPIVDAPKRKIEPSKQEPSNTSTLKKAKLDENVVEKKASPSKTKIANRPVQSSNGKGIASFFSKMAEKPKVIKKPAIEEKSHTDKEVVKEKKESPKENTHISKKSKETKTLSKLIDTDNESDEDKVIEQPKKAVEVEESVGSKSKNKTPSSSKKVTKKRSRKDNQTPERSQKRRKRVIEVSDSDEDIFGKASNDEDTDHMSSGNEAPPEPVVKTQKFDPLAPKNKQKKFVDKSYVDEEGYMVTKKEWVTVSGSEDEEPQKEQETPNVQLPKVLKKTVDVKIGKKQAEDKKEAPAAAKGKGKNAKKAANQPSILSFFNKK